MATNKEPVDSAHLETAGVYPVVSNEINEKGQALNTRGRDKAAEFLSQAGHPIVVTPENDRRIARKVDLHLLPILLFVYCLQSLDKTTLSYASVFNLSQDAHLEKTQFSWLGSVVYVAQLVFQPVVAYTLVRFPIGKFLTVMVFCWGAVLCGMTAATNFGGLMAARLLLGAFESCVAPTFIAIIQMWYRRAEQTKRNAAWYATLGIVNILGSLLTYGLGHINSPHLHSYQIIFLFCGLLTVVFSVIMFWFMPDSPMEAKFLNRDDKFLAVERLRMNQMGIGSGVWKWDHVWEALLDPKTWLWFFLMLIISIPSGGISTFGPLIIKSFVNDKFNTILFNMPFGAVQIIATIGGAWLADRIGMKSVVLILLCLPPIAGLVVLHLVPRVPGNQGALLAGYYIISVYPGISPLIYSWSSQNTGGDTKRKVTTAMLFIGASVGNIIGPQLFTEAEAPRYERGLRVNLALFVVLAALILIGMGLITLLNRRQAAKRKAMGKSEQIVDLSMRKHSKSNHEADAINQAGDSTGANAFEDTTDMKNEDFIYVY